MDRNELNALVDRVGRDLTQDQRRLVLWIATSLEDCRQRQFNALSPERQANNKPIARLFSCEPVGNGKIAPWIDSATMPIATVDPITLLTQDGFSTHVIVAGNGNYHGWRQQDEYRDGQQPAYPIGTQAGKDLDVMGLSRGWALPNGVFQYSASAAVIAQGHGVDHVAVWMRPDDPTKFTTDHAGKVGGVGGLVGPEQTLSQALVHQIKRFLDLDIRENNAAIWTRFTLEGALSSSFVRIVRVSCGITQPLPEPYAWVPLSALLVALSLNNEVGERHLADAMRTAGAKNVPGRLSIAPDFAACLGQLHSLSFVTGPAY